jgi:CubicO group peptidase (beta-lactamase class C family)
MLVLLCLSAVTASLMQGLLIQSQPVNAQEPAVPWPTNGWQTSSPEAQGMNSVTLAGMLALLTEQKLDIHSVLVIRNGYLVLEAYQYPYTASDLHTAYSVTKSVTSLAFGIALDQGAIESVDQPVLDFFPDTTVAELDDAKQSMTLENLLTMSAGYNWPGGLDEPLLGDMMDTDDWIQYTLDRPMHDHPGATFVYNSAVSNLIAAVVTQATGQPLLEFTQANLFNPLGITSVKWASDPQGRNLGGFGLQLMPRDLAKIGYLVLNGGQWDGKQIISEDWIAASTREHIKASPLADGYGYQWWTNSDGYVMAIGFGGQFIIIHPEHQLVVVFTGATPPGGIWEGTFLKNFILPAIESDAPLPENADGQASLSAAIDALAAPQPQPIPALPDIVDTISGQEYQLDANDLGWDTLTLTFDTDDSVQLVLNGGSPLTIGLDGVPRVNDVNHIPAIHAIGFDNILRVYPVAGEEPMLMTGQWQRDTRFMVDVALRGTVNTYQLTFTFEDDTVQVRVLNELSGASLSAEGRVS